MSGGEFRFAYFTSRYEETVSFYTEGLGLPLVHSWDRGADDRGTLIAAASGLIEILALPPSGHAEHLFDERVPQGAFMVIEFHDLTTLCQRAHSNGLAIQQDLGRQSWGHESFCVREPNGLTLYFFKKCVAAA
jgi:catechol 2,3-dioxygenase-like lactoylglutathione lyase family enzyme